VLTVYVLINSFSLLRVLQFMTTTHSDMVLAFWRPCIRLPSDSCLLDIKCTVFITAFCTRRSMQIL